MPALNLGIKRLKASGSGFSSKNGDTNVGIRGFIFTNAKSVIALMNEWPRGFSIHIENIIEVGEGLVISFVKNDQVINI